jgi:inward rectifier potassium channel
MPMNPKKILYTFKKEKVNDVGFGTLVNDKGGRYINKDGSFNVKRTGLPFIESFSIFHFLITTHWTRFASLIFVSYLIVNFIFGTIYYLIGVENLGGIITNSELEKFSEAFFFSTQTFTTVGYGRINPVGLTTNIISSLESLSGLLFFALISGLLWGRFSKPTVKIIYSQTAIIAPYFDISGLMFRIANMRNNQLLDVSVQVALSRIEEIEGKQSRKYYNLSLERSTIEFFPLSWTIVHPIDSDSPLNGIGAEDLEKSDTEIMILIRAFDDTFAQNVHSRNSYKFSEIRFGEKFKPIFSRMEDGFTKLELDKISDTIHVTPF